MNFKLTTLAACIISAHANAQNCQENDYCYNRDAGIIDIDGKPYLVSI